MTELQGQDAIDLLNDQIAKFSNGINEVLEKLDSSTALATWLDTIRAIEEFINILCFPLAGSNEGYFITNINLRSLDPSDIQNIQAAMLPRFGSAVTQRFVTTVMQSFAIGQAFRLNGYSQAAAGFETIGHAIGYFQSRRRHLITLLYCIPTACRGKANAARMDTLNQLLPCAESGVNLTGLHQNLMLAKVFSDFKLRIGTFGFSANHQYQPLDGLFLEPERAGLMELIEAIPAGSLKSLEPIDPQLIFSAAEVRNDIRIIEAAYTEFHLETTAFGPMSDFVRLCLGFCEDNYYVRLSPDEFTHLTTNSSLFPYMIKDLVHEGDDYVSNTNVYAPFIKFNECYITTVTLLSRFIYYWKNYCLNRLRRYQIRTGFIFEESVKEALSNQGYTVTDIKRINRKEFDVVAILGNVIYNVQCKNNLIDINRMEKNVDLFSRYNRHLDRYYAQALKKEEAREQLLKVELGVNEVRHYVVSRFPIASDNPRVMAFSNIKNFRNMFSK